MRDNTLIVFVRRPELGKVKTRLAKTMGDKAALAIYLQLLDKTKQAISDFSGNLAIYYSEESGAEIFWKRKVDVNYQKGNDLGERMYLAIKDQLQFSNKVVLVGSDCPAITPDIIEQAFISLDNFDTVVGPTEDGGYYLIGMKRLQNDLFENMMWSTSKVYEETIQRLENNDTSYLSLPLLFDVDEEEDYRRCLREGLL